MKEKLQESIYNGLKKLRVKASKAKHISVSVVGVFFTMTGLSVGSIVVYTMKKKIKTINKTKKKYFLFGKKGKKEYFRF